MPQPIFTDNFIAKYANKKSPMGPLGAVTIKRTYARRLDPDDVNSPTEEFYQILRRALEGALQLALKHGASREYIEQIAGPMYDAAFNLKWLPSGRGLWMSGTGFLESRTFAAAYNCAFYTTQDIDKDPTYPFTAMMDSAMLGVGPGFDTRGAGKITINKVYKDDYEYMIPDCREGWVHALKLLLEGYFRTGRAPVFNYSKIRGPGLPIKGFGGVSSGPDPLQRLLEINIPGVLNKLSGKMITIEAIVDIMNWIGVCVVAGNVRRTAQIAVGTDDPEFIDLKDWTKYPEECNSRRWASNNSVLCEVGQDYQRMVDIFTQRGDPGFMWLDNAQKYGRMADGPIGPNHPWHPYIYEKGIGCNPCQPGYATVITKEGIRTIDDIDVGSTIWTGSKWTRVIRKVCNGEKEVYRYRTSSGSFVGTKNHRVVQKDGSKVEVGSASHLIKSVGPVVLAGNEIRQAVIDGLVLGDGFVHKESLRPILCIGKNDQDVLSYTGARFKERHFYYIEESGLTREETPPLPIREIPDRYFYADPETVCSFLRGLYSANGSVVSGRVTLKAASFALMDRVQQMLSSLGINSYFTVNRSKSVKFSNGEYVCKQSYDLNITSGRKLFLDKIGFIHSYKNEKLAKFIEGMRGIKAEKLHYDITAKEFLGKELVYDITLEDEKHVYWSGGILSSNCGEITLEHGEFCNLSENFPFMCDSIDDFIESVKFSYYFAKCVTLGEIHDPVTNEVQKHNRRLGVSQSSVVYALEKFGWEGMKELCDRGYNELRKLDIEFSDMLGIPTSNKITTIKPSGTISLIPGVSCGMHEDPAPFYIKAMRFAKDSNLLPAIRKAGYRITKSCSDDRNVIVYFPVKGRGTTNSSARKQLELARFLQKYWSDNMVSCTISFTDEEVPELNGLIKEFDKDLKAISFLRSNKTEPLASLFTVEELDAIADYMQESRTRVDRGEEPLPPHKDEWAAYSQTMPWIPITEELYEALQPAHDVEELLRNTQDTHEVTERFCDGGACQIGGK